jgi:hypothetical protein
VLDNIVVSQATIIASLGAIHPSRDSWGVILCDPGETPHCAFMVGGGGGSMISASQISSAELVEVLFGRESSEERAEKSTGRSWPLYIEKHFIRTTKILISSSYLKPLYSA